jgi:hypothetical protein
MDAFLVGGPSHGRVEEIEEGDTFADYPSVLQIAQAKSPHEKHEWEGLHELGIEPPVGSVILYYVRLSIVTNPLVYLFVAIEGDLDKLREEIEDEEED